MRKLVQPLIALAIIVGLLLASEYGYQANAASNNVAKVWSSIVTPTDQFCSKIWYNGDTGVVVIRSCGTSPVKVLIGDDQVFKLGYHDAKRLVLADKPAVVDWQMRAQGKRLSYGQLVVASDLDA